MRNSEFEPNTRSTGVAVYFTLRKVVEPQDIYALSNVVLMAQIPNLLLGLAGAALVWRVDRV